MGVIQSGINRTLGMLAGGSVALQKKAGFGLFGKGNELSQRQEQAQQKTKQVQEAKTKQRHLARSQKGIDNWKTGKGVK